MIDVAVKGLVHSEYELSHTQFLSLNGTSTRSSLRYKSDHKLDRLILFCNWFVGRANASQEIELQGLSQGMVAQISRVA